MRVRRTRAGVEVRLQAAERLLLADCYRDLIELLGADSVPDAADPHANATADPLEALTGLGGSAAEAPHLSDDPAIARLLPDAYGDDAGKSAEFRRFTEAELRAGKIDAARAVLAQVSGSDTDKLLLAPEAAESWLSSLTDLRLVIGTRLEVPEDPSTLWRRLPDDDPRKHALLVYDWLGLLQDRLVRAVAGW